jgi:hypothetical protein
MGYMEMILIMKLVLIVVSARTAEIVDASLGTLTFQRGIQRKIMIDKLMSMWIKLKPKKKGINKTAEKICLEELNKDL